jgi:hypothetical protein
VPTADVAVTGGHRWRAIIGTRKKSVMRSYHPLHPNYQPWKIPFPEGQTIIHCRVAPDSPLMKRSSLWISPTTYLIQDNGNRKNLLHAEGVRVYRDSAGPVHPGSFTLYFEGLDPSCRTFDLMGDTIGPGAFAVRDIPIHVQGVYRVWIP